MAILLPEMEFNSFIFCLVLLENRPDLFLGRVVVTDTKLPVWIALSEDAVETLAQMFWTCVVSRNGNADQRCIGIQL